MTAVWIRVVLIALLLMTGIGTARAHALGQSYLYLRLSETAVAVRFELAAADVNQAIAATLPTDEKLTVEQVEPYAKALERYLRERSSVRPDGQAREMRFERISIRDTETAQYVLTHFTIEGLAEAPSYIDIDYEVMFDRDPDQSGVLVIGNNWKSHTFANEAGISLVFDPSSTSQRLDLTGSTLLTGLWAMMVLGMEHIMEGLDHVLFLLAILLPAVARRERGQWEIEPRFRTAIWNVVKIVTVFTVAYITHVACPPGAEGTNAMKVFRIAGTIGVLTDATSGTLHRIWFKARMWNNIVDGIVYGVALGAIFAAMWPKG